jgi:hypothetical protein
MQRRIPSHGDECRGLDYVLDLAAIDGNLREGIQVALSYPLGDGEKVAPNVAPRGGGELGIVDSDVDAGAECSVEGLNAVGSEEKDAFVVFEDTEED